VTRVVHVQKVSGVSGSEAHLLSLLPGLSLRGFDVRMIVLHEGEAGARTFVDAMRAGGVPTSTIRMHLDVDPVAFARLVGSRTDIMHTHLVHADVLGLPAAALARVPVRISTKHGFNEFRANNLVARVDRLVGRFAHRQIAISNGLARYLSDTEGFAQDAFTVIHYGIDAGPPPPPPPSLPRLVAVGRLIPIKGFDLLFEAFRKARADVPQLTLEVAGAGPLEGELRAAAPEGVTLLGRVSPISPVYERNAIVVVPSRGEGFGMVALEAAERGRAAIVFDVGGLPEVVDDGRSGIVVAPEDVGGLAAAISSLALDPERVAAFGAAARHRALAHFSSASAVEGVERVYREELTRRSTAAAARSTRRKSNGTR
jgi:glycosyltransferase involved in cell wall biosynthesis